MTKTLGCLFIAASAFVAAIVGATTPARAEIEHAWCAHGSIAGGSQFCSFNTVEQCRAYVSGQGFCQPNPRAALAAMPKRPGRN